MFGDKTIVCVMIHGENGSSGRADALPIRRNSRTEHDAFPDRSSDGGVGNDGLIFIVIALI